MRAGGRREWLSQKKKDAGWLEKRKRRRSWKGVLFLDKRLPAETARGRRGKAGKGGREAFLKASFGSPTNRVNEKRKEGESARRKSANESPDG